jgi:hypothetical protein
MNATDKTKEITALNPTFKHVCLASCQKLLAQIERTKDAIVAEFRETLGEHEQMLHLALNEAEALAWQTTYPHLIFPTLAVEKAQAVASWHRRQRSIQRTGAALELAA